MFKDKSAVESVKAAAPATVLAQSRTRRKRFLLVGTAALAAIAVAMGVSFLDSSGTTSLTISQGTSDLVYVLSGTSNLPVGNGSTVGPLTTTAFSGASSLTNGTSGTCGTDTQGAGGAITMGTDCGSVVPTANTVSATSPSWSPVVGSAGTVTTSGDLAVIDATGATNYVTVNMYVTNLSKLAVDYSSFAFPINVYSTTCPVSGACAKWSEALTVSPYYTYLTDTSGVLTFNLAAGSYYDIVMEGTDHATGGDTPDNTNTPSGVGGAFYTNQDSSSGTLEPSFYFNAYAS